MSNNRQRAEDVRAVLSKFYDAANFLHDLSGTDYDDTVIDFKKRLNQETLDMILLDTVFFSIVHPSDSQLTEGKLWTLFRLVLDLGASATYIHPTGATAIKLCVCYNKLKEAKHLLERGANVNSTHIPAGQTRQVSCLEVAAARGYTEMAEMLIKYGAEMRLNDLLVVVADNCPDNLEIMPLLVEANRNLVIIEYGDGNPETHLPVVHIMFETSWERFEECHLGKIGGVNLQKGSEATMKNIVYLMSEGWAGPTAEMLVTLIYKGRFGALVEYFFGCVDNGLPIVFPTQLDFQSVDREEILAQQSHPGQFYPNRGKSTASAILRRISCRPGEVMHIFNELGANIKNECMVPRLENLSIISLRKRLMRHGTKRFPDICRDLPLPSSLFNMLTLDDLKSKFENEIKALETESSQV